ncbi:MAG: hypothetical protein A3F13_03515 [Gammaproteobacteria bacterium RIFCSPHIGHO2_12_FULL_40_19]|nr:MAG: hypothetical protein A3F13_03515 [Gammaproteobacteria bacterium RIFCSPHIGHO2_12_FULL_40_19]
MNPLNHNEKILLKIFQDILDDESISLTDSFFELGGDSLSMLQCIARANQAGLDISYETFLINPTISYLANLFSQRTLEKDDNGSEKNIPLIPLQKRFFLKPKHWSEVKLIPRSAQLDKSINLDAFKESCKKLFSYHDALNLKFYCDNNEWCQQTTKPDENFYFDVLDLKNEPDDRKNLMLNSYIEKQISQFDLKSGYLVKFLLINVDDKEPYHFIIASHHLCMDGNSHQILLQDIFDVYKNSINKNYDFKLYQTTSFEQWAYFLSRYANLNEVKKDLAYWRKIENVELNAIPIDYSNTGQANLACDIVEYEGDVSLALSKLICKDILKSFKQVSVLDVLLSSLLFVLNDYTNSNHQLVDIRRHGRDFINNDIDLTKTVGWLTAVHPVLLHANEKSSIKDTVNEVHRHLAEIPKNGLSYGLLRYSTDDDSIKAIMENLPQAQIAFNYHGVIDSIFSGNDLFSFSKKSTGNNLGSNATRSHLLNIDMMVCNQKIHVIWTYSKKFHKQSTISALHNHYVEMLEKVAHSLLSNSLD